MAGRHPVCVKVTRAASAHHLLTIAATAVLTLQSPSETFTKLLNEKLINAFTKVIFS